MVYSEAEKKERARIANKKYRDNNREKIAEYNKKYQKENPKSYRIANWKRMGLIWDSQEEIDGIYNRWLNSERCEKKGCEYTETNWKCMDHEHKNGKYGKFRNVLCHICNSNTDIQIGKNNSSGVLNISWSNTKKRWIYKKTINGKTYRKSFKYFIQAVIYKREFEEDL